MMFSLLVTVTQAVGSAPPLAAPNCETGFIGVEITWCHSNRSFPTCLANRPGILERPAMAKEGRILI